MYGHTDTDTKIHASEQITNTRQDEVDFIWNENTNTQRHGDTQTHGHMDTFNMDHAWGYILTHDDTLINMDG